MALAEVGGAGEAAPSSSSSLADGASSEGDGNTNDDELKCLSDRERYALFDAFVCKYLAAFYIDGDTENRAGNVPADSFSPVKNKRGSVGVSSTGGSSTSSSNDDASSSSSRNGETCVSPSSGLRAHLANDSGLPLALKVANVALRFHAPHLAASLAEAGVGPELYATPWLVTAHARGTPLDLVFKVWDLLVAVDDPALLPLLGIGLVQ